MSPGCRSGSSPGRPRWSGCSPPRSGRTALAERVLARRPPVEVHPQVRPRPGSRPGAAGLPAPLSLAVQRVRPVRTAVRRRQHVGPDQRRCTPTTSRSSPSTPRSSTGRPTSKRCTARPITAPVRRMDALRRKRGARPTTMKDLSKDTAGQRALAIFDLDGTIMSTNVIEQYLWSRLPELSPARQLAEVGQRAAEAALLPARRTAGPGYVPARGLPPLRRRRSGGPGAVRRHHAWPPRSSAGCRPRPYGGSGSTREAGHTTILITGVVRPLTRPLAPLFDVIVAADLATDADGRCTGLPHRPAAGRGVPRRLAAALRRRCTASSSTAASPTPTPIPICRCCRRSATRSRSVPTSP